MHFGLYLLRQERISGPQFIQAVSHQLQTRPQIGALAIETRRLSMRDLFKTLSMQSTANKSFGQVAVELGVLTSDDVRDLLAIQLERTTPLGEVLVELGAISPQAYQREMRAFRVGMAEGANPAHNVAFLEIEAIEAAFANYELIS